MNQLKADIQRIADEELSPAGAEALGRVAAKVIHASSIDARLSEQADKILGRRKDPTKGGANKLEDELRGLLNRHCIENDSNTPDYVLAQYIMACLGAFAAAVDGRDNYYGVRPTGTSMESK